jgi:hypothetical protein
VDTRSASNRYHDTMTDLTGKAVPRKTTPRFASGAVEVNVIFTDLQATSAALKVAKSFARDLGARIRLRAAIAVPFRLPLDQPPVPVAFLRGMLRKLVPQLEKDTFDPTVHLYLCRDQARLLLQALRSNSVVVIGGRKRWWPTAQSLMADALRSKGHRVIFVDSRARTGSEQPTFAR